MTYHHGMRRFQFICIAAVVVALLFAAAGPVLIAEGSLHIANRPHADAQAAAYYARRWDAQWRDATITAPDGVRLAAWYFMPAEFNGGAVLLLHGIADTRLGVTAPAELLTRAGYAVLLPDSRGHGASGGDLVTYGLAEARDAAQWAHWLAIQSGVERTYALGESLGAAVAIQSLVFDPGFRAIVAECPFARFDEIAVYRVAQRVFGLHVFARPLVSLASLYAEERYGVNLMRISPLEALRGSHTPVLLIHGTADRNIPPSQSRELAAANRRYTELWLVPGAVHTGALAAEPGEYRSRVRDWFASH